MLSETLMVLQEVISSSVIVGARPELGAFLHLRYYESARRVLMYTITRNIGITWIARTCLRRESTFRVGHLRKPGCLPRGSKLIGSHEQHQRLRRLV